MSKFDMVKFEKGQIWEIFFKDGNEPKGREQGKDRPWIILSTRKFNQSSGMVTAAPLTTRDAIRSPAQVIFEDMRGKNSVILCEQMRTFDYNSGSYIFEYVGTVSDEVIEMLDNALTVHLGLRFAPSTLERLYQSIESIMRSLEMSKTHMDAPKFTDDDVIRFAEMLESLVPKPKAPAVTREESIEEDVCIQEEEPQINNPHHPDNVAYNMNISKEPPKVTVTDTPITLTESSNKSEPEVSSCSENKTGKRKWTKELCEEFLNDMETLPMKEVMNKWGMTKKTQAYYTKHYVKDMLGK